ncbi:hypothetical protein [Nitrosomonas marina]|uniref:Uncharacterized protein n=1 Tax=Nitrosomonas marina TaxID=917 RepID=A0A1H8G6Z3_9PROT|nr:hypothetical protein [Nitrosomonas marina]SEN39639.1 hypothetical protein SAMN05216325_11664 [Nitrosomonas marina]
MEMEFAVKETSDFDEMDEVLDEMMADSHVVRIIEEMEFVENEINDFDYFDESDIRYEMRDTF